MSIFIRKIDFPFFYFLCSCFFFFYSRAILAVWNELAHGSSITALCNSLENIGIGCFLKIWWILAESIQFWLSIVIRCVYPEWGNPITKELKWNVLTDQWILTQKLSIARYKVQYVKHMKLKKNEDQSVDTLLILRIGNNHPWKELQRQSLELRQKDGPSRDCHIQGSIP